jgi:hypothetical protein
MAFWIERAIQPIASLIAGSQSRNKKVQRGHI